MLASGCPPDVRANFDEDLLLAVRFEGDCWLLDCGQRFETLVYRSGGAAETAARTLAARLAECGQGVHLSVEDRGHAVVGTRLYFPFDGSARFDRSAAGHRV